MKWLLNPFSQEKPRVLTSPDEKNQNFAGVLHIVIEETILAVAQWLISFTKQMLENTPVPSHQSANVEIAATNTGIENASTTVEDLTFKVTSSIQQLCDRVTSSVALEDRISSIEQLLVEHPQQASTTVDQAVSNEDVWQEVNSLIQQLQQVNQRTLLLETHIVYLEKLLVKYNAIPRILKQQQSTIASLQSQISQLATPHQNSHHKPDLQLTHLRN